MEKEILSQNLQEINLQVFSSKDNFETAQRMAVALSNSAIVPNQYRGRENVANCIIALEMANRMQMSPLNVMQNLYLIHGNPAWSSKFLISVLNASGRFSTLRYEFDGEEGTDEWKCRAWAIDKYMGEKLYGAWVSIAMAKKEGWYQKSGSKWQTMPQLMLQYRAAAFFQRVYAPEISMGMHTAEEMEDIAKENIIKESVIIKNTENTESVINITSEDVNGFEVEEEKQHQQEEPEF